MKISSPNNDKFAAPMRNAGQARQRARDPFADLQEQADKAVAKSPLGALARRASQAPLQAKFGDETTFGMEIEFQNRWISQFDYKKSVTSRPVGFGLAGWKAESDAGRINIPTEQDPGKMELLSGTVLEVESRPYTAAEMKDGTAQKDLRQMYTLSRMTAKDSANSSEISGRDAEQRRSGARTAHQIREADKVIEEDHAGPPEATLQITTVGKRSDENLQALTETSGAFDDMNKNIMAEMHGEGGADYAKKLSNARARALTFIGAMRAHATALTNGPAEDRKAAALVFEDLASVLSPMVMILKLAELGVSGGWGTIKNLIAPVMPRRVIRPPVGGFAQALGINATIYQNILDDLLTRSDHLGDKLNVDFHFLWAMAAQGQGKDARIIYPDGETVAGFWTALEDFAQTRDESKTAANKVGVSLLHTIAESEPTLENKILKSAGKPLDGSWTSHEIRNALYATRMPYEQMAKYLKALGDKT